jgi:hypothetical protein
MKTKYLPLLFIGLMIAGLVSCKKGAQTPVVGKWTETKLRLYEDNGNAVIYDTTYLQPFTNFDYIQFNNNNTCVTSTDHYYYPNTDGYPKNPQQIAPQSFSFNYTAVGSKYVLTPQTTLVNPGGFITADTVIVTGENTLMLRSVSYGHIVGPVKTVADSYYTKQ